jgi:predicted phage tail component-like protein
MTQDFIDLKFGEHWASDFNLVVVSTGDRYTPPVYGDVNVNTSTVAGKRGVYKWKTQIGAKTRQVRIAFDSLKVEDVNLIKEWLDPMRIRQLIFSEEPYKYYYACVAQDINMSFLPFLEGNTTVKGMTFNNGVYKGEFTIDFLCIDNYGYSDFGCFELAIKEFTGYDNLSPWVTMSNLLNNSTFYKNNNIYTASIGDTYTLSPNNPFYLLNSGNIDADLYMTFDFIALEPEEQIIITNTKTKWSSIRQDWDPFQQHSQIAINYFENYRPYQDFIKRTSGIADAANVNRKDYRIIIDSSLNEVFLEYRLTGEKFNLNKFNDTQTFVTLAGCNYVDYAKPFPTLINEIGDSALENTILNQIKVPSNWDKALTGVSLIWHHTYL